MPSNSTSLVDAAPITYANLAGCICFYAYAVMASSTAHSLGGETGGLMRLDIETLVRLGASWHEGLWNGGWQRLVLPMFLHGGLMHIVMNMLCLWSMGPSAERHFGSANFGTIYYLSGIGGFCLSMLFGGRVSVGASGCIFGIEGAYLAVLIMSNARWTTAYRSADVRRTALMIAILYIALMLGPGTDNWAHLGGLIFGVVYGLLFEYWRKHQRVGLAMIVLMLSLTAGLIAITRWTIYDPWYHVYTGLQAEEAGRADEAQDRFAAARESARRFGRSEQAGVALIERARDASAAGKSREAAQYLRLVEDVGREDAASYAHLLLSTVPEEEPSSISPVPKGEKTTAEKSEVLPTPDSSKSSFDQPKKNLSTP